MLTQTETELARYLGNERQAVVLAPHVDLRRDNIEQAVIKALVKVLESIHGNDILEYAGGQRRDTMRDPFHDEGNATNHQTSQCGQRCRT